MEKFDGTGLIHSNEGSRYLKESGETVTGAMVLIELPGVIDRDRRTRELTALKPRSDYGDDVSAL